MRALSLLAVVAGFWASAAIAAAEPPAGTKNFTAPTGVPNYFSNEAGGPMAQRGIVHHVAPEPAYAVEAPRTPIHLAAARHRPVRHAASHRKRRAAKLAARNRHHPGKSKRTPVRVAAAKHGKPKVVAAKSGSSQRQTARSSDKAKPIKAAARAHSAPAKAKPAPHHAG